VSNRYASYSGYKPSETDWLGDIPQRWETIRSGFLYRREKRVGFVEEELLSVYRDHGVVPKSSRDDNFNKPSDDLSPYQLVERGDLVLNKMKTWQGSIAVSEHQGIVSPAYFVYSPEAYVSDRCHSKYLHYLLRSPLYISQYLRSSKGIRVNQWDLDPDLFKQIEVLLPHIFEQRAIASFLDRETGKIDRMIGKQERMIELLKEKRQAVISHAVTKGLDPNAPMKDSGIEWLGEIPEHWDVRAISKSTTKITNGYVGPTRGILVESGVPYVQATHIKRGVVNFDGAYFVNKEWSYAHSKSILKNGDVLIVQTGAGTGDVGLVSENEVGYNCHALIILTPNKKVITGDYLASTLQSHYGYSKLYSIRTGGMHPHLNCGEVQFVKTPIPPVREQQEIIQYVEKQTARFDRLTEKAKQAIGLMKERRTALISAAVTGKIDVREAVTYEAEKPLLMAAEEPALYGSENL